MADGITVTITGDTALIALLDTAVLVAEPEAKKLVGKGALNIKKDWQQRWAGIRHAPRLPRAVTYETRAGVGGGGWIEAQIGPEDSPDNQGFLGAVIEFGGLHNAPRPGGLPALEAEAPRFEAALEALSRRLLP